MDLLTTYTRLRTTSNYSATANVHKSPQHPLSLSQPAVFTSRSLSTASKSGDSSASRAQVQSSLSQVQNCLSTDVVPSLYHLSTDHVETPRFQLSLYCCVRIRCRGNVFTEPSPRNGRCLQRHRLAAGLHTTVYRFL
jgi:hypothetical protein